MIRTRRHVCADGFLHLLVDGGHYFLLRPAIFTGGNFEDFRRLGVIGALDIRQQPEPHDDEAELST